MTESKYTAGQLIETNRGSVTRIAAVFYDAAGVEPPCFLCKSTPNARGFFIPESEIARVLG